jgi:glycosyltransferase involved in cell wall biosynthesis
MNMLTFAFCTFNRANRLERLVAAMRAQRSPVPFEILAINNNSADHTVQVLDELARQPGAPLRWVTEPVQGIVAARNRAIAEAIDSDILVFIDDDEVPQPGLLEAASDAILHEGAQCVGGRVVVDFTTLQRPRWLRDELLGFLAAVDYGKSPFWIRDEGTPIWTANVAYDVRLFRDDPSLRFDQRYDRVGKGIGGGEDFKMFTALLQSGARIRYRPEMSVLHAVEPWRLKRRYFLRVHYRSGMRRGKFELPIYPRLLLGVPPFMLAQFTAHCWTTVRFALRGHPSVLRQAMNATFALGAIVGYRQR